MKNNTDASQNEEESRQVLGKTKRIKDATLIDANSKKENDVLVIEPEIIDDGEKDAPPLEMTDDVLQEISEKETEKEDFQKEVRSATKHFNNGKNKWELIAKTYNQILDWEHVTTAMDVTHGVLVCVKEAIGQKMHSTMTYVPGIALTKDENDKWQIG